MKVTTRTILALYRAANLVLNPKFKFDQAMRSFCMMGALYKVLNRVRNVNKMFLFYFSTDLGLPRDDFDRLYSMRGISRDRAASHLRELANSYILARRRKTKMDVKALLRAATFIENHPYLYNQRSGGGCLAYSAACMSSNSFKPDSFFANNPASIQEVLGLTDKQFNALWNFKGGFHAYTFTSLPIEKQAKIGAQRLRRMALNGS